MPKDTSVKLVVVCSLLVCSCCNPSYVSYSGGEAPAAGTLPAAQESQAFTAAQKTVLVTLHNQFRTQVKPAATAGSIPSLAWDAQAEQYALNWTKCVNYDTHRGDVGQNPLSMGENIYTSDAMGETFDITQEAKNSVTMWNNETVNYNYQNNVCKPVDPNNQECGHYTQVVWAASTLVGCAYALNCPDSGNPWATTTIWIVCNYKKAGNCNGQRPYSSGSTLGGSCFPGVKY